MPPTEREMYLYLRRKKEDVYTYPVAARAAALELIWPPPSPLLLDPLALILLLVNLVMIR